MRAWTSPPVPSLAVRGLGTGPALTVHDTASQSRLRLAPQGRARMYVCGITPYDATHLGHAATYVTFDVLQRVWRDAGLTVAYVQNVTDVDDPLLERADRDGLDWRDLAEREVALFREDMAALRVLAPDHYTGVVESMDLVSGAVARLRGAGATYEVDGDLYFHSAAEPDFGAVGGYDRDTMQRLFAERGGDPERPGKRDPLDWLLWRAERPGEPAWDSDLGRGRPGWHVECAAMAVEHLGLGFEVQAGGSDLIFPHHEMSAAEGQTAYGQRPFAQAYVHQAMVGLDGDKMSKSRGNLVLVSRLRADGVDPMAVRLALLAHHYRADWSWTDRDLPAAERRLASWRSAGRAGADGGVDPARRTAGRSAGDGAAYVDPVPVVDAVRAALADDLDTPTALAAVDGWAERVGAGGEPDGPTGGAAAGGAREAARTVTLAVDALLGVAL